MKKSTTAIAGIAKDGKVWIGGDSAGIDVGNLALTVRGDEKVFVNGDFVFGFTSSFRMGQLLRYSFEPPAKIQDQSLNEYMVTTFIDAVRECLKNGGFQEKENEVETGGTFLVGHQGHLFMIDTDYQVGESLDGYDAVGCGSQVSKGALFVLKETHPSLDPEKQIEMALQAAEHHSGGVRGPFHVVSV
jgi:ATP-dependent protease HslVU (ClpYQ) peptidase subunit